MMNITVASMIGLGGPALPPVRLIRDQQIIIWRVIGDHAITIEDKIDWRIVNRGC